MTALARVWRALTGYFSHPDPRLALGGTVALIVLGNQPFYPLYVHYAVGMAVPAAYLTWLSAPLFLAAAALARRWPDGGRILLLVAAIGNTILSARVLGPATGVELFDLPCLLVAWATVPPGRRLRTMLGAGTAVLAGVWIARGTGAPLAHLDDSQAHALVLMHAVSVVCLLAVVGFQAWRIGRREAALTPAGP